MAIAIPNRIPRRIVDVVVGRAGSEGTRFRGFANADFGLWITARIEHTSGSRPNKAKVTIRNLTDRNAALVEQSRNTVQVLAGVDAPGLLFRGDVSRSETRQDSPTRETIIEAAEGQRVYRDGQISRSWPPNTPRSQIFSDGLVAMGAARGYVSPRLPEVRFAGGFVWAGPVSGMFDLLWDADAGERWSIQAGVVDVVAAGETKPGNAVLLTSETGLIGVPRRTKGGGVKFKTKLSARIRPNSGVEIASQIGAGIYRVTKVTHEVDSRGLVWQTQAEAVRV